VTALAEARTPWYRRAAAWVSALFARQQGQIPDKREIKSVGDDYDMAAGSAPTYAHERALSSLGAFPSTFASVERRAEDLSGISVYVSLDRNGQERLDDHPFLDLFEQPNTAQPGVEFWRQVYADFDLARNALIFVMRDGRGAPVSLLRLHPGRIEPVPGPLGLPIGYMNKATNEQYSVDDVVHVRGISWEDDARSLHGTSPILALDSTLTAEREVRDFTGRAAKTGRPAVIISPHYEDAVWSKDQADQIGDEYAEKVRQGGALVNRHRAEVQIVQTTPADLEAIKTRQANREDVSMVMATPPAVMGIPGSNYAESEQQTLSYWLTHVARARLFEAALTPIARALDSRRVYVRFDFSGVPALQRTRNSQLDRVKTLVELGAGPKAAAEYEGLLDAPLPDEKPSAPAPAPFGAAPPTSDPDDRPEPAQIDDPAGEGDLGEPGDGNETSPSAPRRRSFAAFVRAHNHATTTRDLAYGSSETRAAAWSAWERTAQAPAQKRLQARLQVVFAQQRARVLDALDKQTARSLTTRAVDASTIFAYERELALMVEAIEEILRDALDAGFTRETVLLGAPSLAFDTRAETAARMASEVSRLINDTTAKVIKGHVDDHLRKGTTTQELRAKLEDEAKFKPSRALTIARTESAHAVNKGQTEAQIVAASKGIDFEVVWLASPDSKDYARRHDLLDGEAVEPGTDFTSPETGASAPGPSQFGSPSDDINCRCTTISRRRK
jgi:HK97 family phage portal protein